MSPFQKIMFREMGRRVNDMNESYLGRSAVWSGTAASAFSSPQAPMTRKSLSSGEMRPSHLLKIKT